MMPHPADIQPMRRITPGRVLVVAIALMIALVVVALATRATAGKGAASSAPTAPLATRNPQPFSLPTFSPAANNPQISQDDPVAPRPAPSKPDPTGRYYTETGHYVSGEFLNFYRANSNSADLFGLPLTEAFQEQFADGSTLPVQYFQ